MARVESLSDSSNFGLESSKALSLESRISGSVPSRVSETNVQVVGIDEPDIVKTDGKEIYYSSPKIIYYPEIDMRDELKRMHPLTKSGGIHLINAYPPASLGLDSEILEQGNLLLDDKNNLTTAQKIMERVNVML